MIKLYIYNKIESEKSVSLIGLRTSEPILIIFYIKVLLGHQGFRDINLIQLAGVEIVYHQKTIYNNEINKAFKLLFLVCNYQHLSRYG